MAEKKYNPEKEYTMFVRSSNNENSARPNTQMKLQSRPINDFPATVRPPPAVYNTSSYIPKFTAQVVSSLMDDIFKLNYEELKRDKPMPFMLPPQWEGPVDYQAMARDGAIHRGQEDISTSDSESKCTVHTGLEEVGVVKHISSSENLKVRMILCNPYYKSLFTAISKIQNMFLWLHWMDDT